MANIKDRLEEIKSLTERLEKDFSVETGGFLHFLKRAESGQGLDEFAPAPVAV